MTVDDKPQVDGADLLRLQGLNGRAIKCVQDGTPGTAIPLYEEALSIFEDPGILVNYSDALARCARFDAAEKALLRAIEIRPHDSQSWYNLGVVYTETGRLEEAVTAFEESCEFRVTAAALNNLGNCRHRLLDLEGADAAYRGALKQGWADARWNRAMNLMMLGRWAEAWDHYESRPQMAGFFDNIQRWRGEPLAGKTLVVNCEQGLGDMVFGLRYLKMLRDGGCRVVLNADPAIVRLARAMDVCDVVDRTVQQSVMCDFVTMMMSLPGYLSPEGIGPQDPYLDVPGVKIEGFNVGLCWNGSTVVGAPAERNIPLKLLKPLSEIPGVRLVSLQKGGAEAEMRDCGFDVYDAMVNVKDVYDTAQVIASMDLVITVDTLIPHLAGALGRPTWLLNRWSSCWQWGTEHRDPCLYSTVAQFRQASRGDWSRPIEMVTSGLRYVAEEYHKRQGETQ